MSLAVGRYELETRVAEGALGPLWRARMKGDAGFSRPVAVRSLPSALGGDRRFVAAYTAAASELMELASPHVEQILDLVVDDGVHVVTEWLEGLSVRAWMDAHDGPVPWQLAVEIAIEALRGLAPAHAVRLTHDGLRPEALRISPDGSVKLTRFGVAAALAASGAGRRDVEAKGLRHPAPELLEGGGTTPATDLFGLGALLFEILAGRPPHDAPAGPARDAQVAQLAPDLAALRADVPPLLVAIIERALSVDPAGRHASARAMIDALSALSRSEPELAGPDALGLSVREALEARSSAPSAPAPSAPGGPAALAASIRGMVGDPSPPKKPRGLTAQRTMHVDAEELSELIGDADGPIAEVLESRPPPDVEEDEAPKRYRFEKKERTASAKASAQRGLRPVVSEAEPLPLTKRSRPQGLAPAKTEFLDEAEVDALTVTPDKRKPRGLSPAKTEFLDEDQVDALEIDD